MYIRTLSGGVNNFFTASLMPKGKSTLQEIFENIKECQCTLPCGHADGETR